MTEFIEVIKNAASWIWEFDQVRFTIDALIKLGVTTILSGFIGFEREHSHRPAGFRTHILVSVGSALMMIISQYGFEDLVGTDTSRYDPARIAAQVVSGIGFIGAGTIILQKHMI